MADKKISQLTALSAANVASATDVLAIVDTSATETKKITAKDLIDGALNGGTANGVLYLNGSKVATSGSALTFDGTTVLTTPRINVTNTGIGATFSSSGGSGMRLYGSSGTNQWDIYLNGANVRFSDNTGGGVVKIDTGAVIDGNLGIGTASPSSFGKLAVVGTSTGTLFAVRDEGTPTGNTFVVSSNANGSAIVVNSSGNVLFGKNISVGGATPTTSGTGITFPATQSASSDANTLDDYEEGTWTPTDTSGAGITLTINAAQYTKIGRAVTVNFEIAWPTTSDGNNASFSMPFTPLSTNRSGVASFSNVAGEVSVYVSGSTSFLLYNDTGGQVTNATMSGKYVIASLVYYT